MIAIAVLYPQTEGSTFDTAYYHSKHMKMVHDLWGSMGLHGSRVMHGVPGPDGSAPTYSVMTVLDFESMDAFKKAAATHGAEIMGDIKNFTNGKPTMQFSEIGAG